MERRINFTKMHGCGNDHLLLDCTQTMPQNPSALAVRILHRHFGVGADGLVLVCPSKTADAAMRIFNADGSEALMCGNAIRCMGKYLYDSGIVRGTTLRIKTQSGVRALMLHPTERGTVEDVCVNMGVYSVQPMARQLVAVQGKLYAYTAVSMGNPHAVCFVENVQQVNLAALAAALVQLAVFPQGVNVELVHVIDSHTLAMRVWERGVGETYACGTGACAAAVAAVINGYAQPNAEVCVKQKGGVLRIRVEQSGTVWMTGPAKTVCEGVYAYEC